MAWCSSFVIYVKSSKDFSCYKSFFTKNLAEELSRQIGFDFDYELGWKNLVCSKITDEPFYNYKIVTIIKYGQSKELILLIETIKRFAEGEIYYINGACVGDSGKYDPYKCEWKHNYKTFVPDHFIVWSDQGLDIEHLSPELG